MVLRELGGTVFGRWYVTLFGLTFLWCAVRQLGWRRTLERAAEPSASRTWLLAAARSTATANAN